MPLIQWWFEQPPRAVHRCYVLLALVLLVVVVWIALAQRRFAAPGALVIRTELMTSDDCTTGGLLTWDAAPERACIEAGYRRSFIATCGGDVYEYAAGGCAGEREHVEAQKECTVRWLPGGGKQGLKRSCVVVADPVFLALRKGSCSRSSADWHGVLEVGKCTAIQVGYFAVLPRLTSIIANRLDEDEDAYVVSYFNDSATCSGAPIVTFPASKADGECRQHDASLPPPMMFQSITVYQLPSTWSEVVARVRTAVSQATTT